MAIEELRAILEVPGLDLCVENPLADAHDSWTEEHEQELAKAYYFRGVRAQEEGDLACALTMLETAYYLVPGKHHFAFRVGELAFATGDCDKARRYLEHYLRYADHGKKPDWEQRTRELLDTPELRACPPEPEDAKPQVCLEMPFEPKTGERRRRQ